MSSEARRKALIIASSKYKDDEHFWHLPGVKNDAIGLESVLSNPQIGDFEVQEPLINQSDSYIRRAIEAFFSRCDRNDLLLLYFSCHGLRDDYGELYFAATNTEYSLLGSTAISSSKVCKFIRGSPANRQILILDCCYSGAFTQDYEIKGDEKVDIWGLFQQQGKGQVILTASNAIQCAFQERERVGCEAPQSFFTKFLIEGLETGNADENGDGQISTDELYRYISKRFVEEGISQSPCKWQDIEGELFIAYSPLNAKLYETYRRASEAQEKGDWDTALKLYKQVAKANSNYRNVAQEILDLERVREAEKIAIENQALLMGLDDDPIVMSYIEMAKQAGLNIDELPRMNLGTLLERVVRLTVDQAVQDRQNVLPLVSTDVCYLLSYLGYVLFTDHLTACDSSRAAQAFTEALEMRKLSERLNAISILDWLKETYWLRETGDGQVAFRDDYARLIFTAIYLRDSMEDAHNVSVLWVSGVTEEPARWKEVMVLLEGMLSENRAIELLEALLERNLVNLAGWCIAKGQSLPQPVVGKVIEALIAQTGERR